MIVLSVTIKIKEEKIQEAKEFFSSFVAPSQAEEGCLQYELFQGAKDKQVFHFFEKWRDQKALDKHNEQPFLRQFLDRVEDLLAAPAEILFLEKVNP